MKSHRKMIMMLIGAVAFGFLAAPAKEKTHQQNQGLAKTSTLVSSAMMNANNVTSWVNGDGSFPQTIQQAWNGEYPKQSGVGIIYMEGIVFGGFVRDGLSSDPLRVTGNTYFNGTSPGRILSDASGRTTGAESVTPASVRPYGVRGDMPPGLTPDKWPNLVSDAATFFMVGTPTAAQIQAVAESYFRDWIEWPASSGAPWYVDTVKITRYDAVYDYNNPHHKPGIPGATKTIWYVCNDLDPSATARLGGSPPIGIEQQMTVWAYASSTPLNDIIFKHVKLIYKGLPATPATARIDSFYVVQWSDPDNGDAGDDFVGSDSLLNLGYVYNSTPNDNKYQARGLAVPAGGYAFLQGIAGYTGNPSDSAIVSFQWRKGYRYYLSRPMTAFSFFASNSPISDPDDGTFSGTNQWFNLMRGMIPRPEYPAGTPFYSSSAYCTRNNIVTPFCMPGDPTKGLGWIDGIDLQSGDRRMLSVHGPITIQYRDTAEVVVAFVAGMGSNNISSVQVMKYNTTFSQYAMNQLFDLPTPPLAPQVSITESDNQITLNWGEDEQKYTELENYRSKTFVFEGYNVYQLPSPSSALSEGVRLVTYDLADPMTVIYNNEVDPNSGYVVSVPKMFGSNNGIKRYLTITQDALRRRPLVNGQEYYFVVTAYGYDASFTSPFSYLESRVLVNTVIPHRQNPGTVVQSTHGQILPVNHSTGVSTLGISPTVVSPDLLTGHQYEVTFFATDSSLADGLDETTANPISVNQPNVKWKLRDVTKDSVLYIERGFTTANNSIIKDGLQWKLNGIPWYLYGNTLEINSVTYTPTANLNIGGLSAGFQAFGHGLDLGLNFSGSSLLPSQCLKNIKIVFSNDPAQQQKCYIYLRGGSPNYGYVAYGTFPGKVYDITDPNALPRQVNVCAAEQNGRAAHDNIWGPTTAAGSDREYLGILSSDYDGTLPDVSGTHHIDYTATTMNSGNLDMIYEMWPQRLSDANPLFVNGDVMTIWANIPPVLTPSANADKYIINTQDFMNLTNQTASAKQEVDDIKVFPNPYYGVNKRETNRLNKWVQFTHLPPNATIRIFNMAGVLVKTISPTSIRGQFVRWDLRNDKALPVASGMYIAHIEMPDLGKNKILKLAIVQEEQVLPTY
ncbi:MAG: T9SS type A sorting domain-containing protein [Ignavibacteriales bacterium]|nr:T9SS type A sorting domain-containing protein [Ignavibacteriales bacterium]